MNVGTRNYLVLVRLGGHPAQNRIVEVGKALKTALDSATYEKDYRPAISSGDGTVIGFVVRTKLSAAQLRARIDTPSSDDEWGLPSKQANIQDPLIATDSILVVELGSGASERGFRAIKAWIDGRQPS